MCLLAAPRPQSPVDEPIAEECLPLIVLLHSLLSSLGRHGHGEAPPGVDCSPPDRWYDDSYAYFESAVAELADCDIDISLHDGKALIRVGRQVSAADGGASEAAAHAAGVDWMQRLRPQDVLDSLAAHIAVLDEAGVIAAVK